MLYLVFNTKSLVSILPNFATNLLYTAFLTTSFFITSLNLLKSTEIGTNLSISNLLNSFFRLAKLVLVQKLNYQRAKYF